jgi:hypothetical protein
VVVALWAVGVQIVVEGDPGAYQFYWNLVEDRAAFQVSLTVLMLLVMMDDDDDGDGVEGVVGLRPA